MFGFMTPLKKPVPMDASPSQENMEEYLEVAKRLNVRVAGIAGQQFLNFMRLVDLPIYHLPTVAKYMDRISARDGFGHGWVWKPLRIKDHEAIFGSARDILLSTSMFLSSRDIRDVRSDSIRSQHTVYDKPVPLRVLKRLERIEKESPVKVSFLVSDYATRDDIAPDPFLLAYLNTAERYVVDFWDEPGFGLNQMIAGGENG